MATSTAPRRAAAVTGADAHRGQRVRTFLLLRSSLVVVTGYLLLGQGDGLRLQGVLVALLAAAMLSNLVLAWWRPRLLDSSSWTAALLLADTLWVTAALLVSGQFSGEFLYLYFFVLFLAALAENLRLIALGALMVSGGYVYSLIAEAGFESLTSPAYLIRVPFLFMVATFYGYFVERVRHQERRGREEAVATARTQTLLRRTNTQLQELNELKSRFVTLVSHELRTPLTATRNALGLVGRAGPVTPEQSHFVDMAGRNLDRLARILDDLLALSRMEAKGLDLTFAAVDPAALLEDSAAAFEAQAAEEAVELAVQVEDGLSAVWADAGRSGQVLANLLSNAFKFTGAGGRVSLLAARDGENTVAITVEDSGPGIPRSEREKIFERFYQVEDVLTRSVRGTGLGLAIARELSACQGGTLTVDSEPGRGSRFTLRLPANSPRAREMAELEARLAPLRVHPFNALLVVEPEHLDGWGSTLGSLDRRLREALPRAGDHLMLQPAAGRVVVLLGATEPDGAMVVAHRLRNHLATDGGGPARVLGPAVHPADGTTAWRLVDRAVAIGDDAAAAAGETP